MDDIKLSIIIPVYNTEGYISICLDSLVKQVKEYVEIIIIDDGSTDNSGKICEDYESKYKYIKYFKQENKGVSVARNNGLNIAKGEYIYFVDGDDLVIDSSIDKILNIISSNQNVDIISSTFIKSYDGTINDKLKIDLKNTELVNNSRYPENILNLFKYDLFNLSLCCNIIRKKLFLENQIFLDSNVKYTEDMDCTLKLLLKAQKILLMESPIYVYRQSRGGSATSKVSLKRVEDNMNFVINWNTKLKSLKISQDLKEEIMNFIKYEYSIVVGLLFMLPKDEFNQMYLNIQKYKDMLEDQKGLKGKLVSVLYKIFGFKIIGHLMTFWIKIK